MIKFEPLKPLRDIKEALERIGIPNQKDGKNQLYTSVIAVMNPETQEYFLVHFKEALEIEGKGVEYKDEDISRLHNITHYLITWGMIKVLDTIEEYNEAIKCRILKKSDLDDWEIIKKYTINYNKALRLFSGQTK